MQYFAICQEVEYLSGGASFLVIFGCIQIALQLISSSLLDFWMWDK